MSSRWSNRLWALSLLLKDPRGKKCKWTADTHTTCGYQFCHSPLVVPLCFFSCICEQNRDCEHSSKASFPVQEKIGETAKKSMEWRKVNFHKVWRRKRRKNLCLTGDTCCEGYLVSSLKIQYFLKPLAVIRIALNLPRWEVTGKLLPPHTPSKACFLNNSLVPFIPLGENR